MSDDLLLRNVVVEMLNAGPLKIKFKKADGTVREMLASLNKDIVTEYERKTDRTKEKNRDVQSVFDLDKNEWRSFRWDNFLSYEYV